MKPSEIIAADAQQNGLDPKEVLQGVANRMQSGASVLIPKNNSILMLTPIAQAALEWNLFTQDTGTKLKDSIEYFLDNIRKTGAKTIYSMTDNQEAMQIIGSLIPVMKSDNSEYDWMGRVS